MSYRFGFYPTISQMVFRGTLVIFEMLICVPAKQFPLSICFKDDIYHASHLKKHNTQ